MKRAVTIDAHLLDKLITFAEYGLTPGEVEMLRKKVSSAYADETPSSPTRVAATYVKDFMVIDETRPVPVQMSIYKDPNGLFFGVERFNLVPGQTEVVEMPSPFMKNQILVMESSTEAEAIGINEIVDIVKVADHVVLCEKGFEKLTIFKDPKSGFVFGMPELFLEIFGSILSPFSAGTTLKFPKKTEAPLVSKPTSPSDTFILGKKGIAEILNRLTITDLLPRIKVLCLSSMHDDDHDKICLVDASMTEETSNTLVQDVLKELINEHGIQWDWNDMKPLLAKVGIHEAEVVFCPQEWDADKI